MNKTQTISLPHFNKVPMALGREAPSHLTDEEQALENEVHCRTSQEGDIAV